MKLSGEATKLNATLGLFASILMFIVLGIIFILVGTTTLLYIDTYPKPERAKNLIDFFGGSGYGPGFILWITILIANICLFLASLFFFISSRVRK